MSDTTKKISGTEYRVTHSVGPNQAGIRLDRFLMDRYTRRSREQLKRAIDSGAVSILRLHSKHLSLGRMKASFALQPGDIVQVLSVRKPEPEVNFNYRILYQDDAILVIDKPPRLPVHPAGRFFFNTLLIHLKTDGFKLDLASERKFFLVHRIDKETSGVLLLAKTKEACNALTSQFRNRETQKYYLAIGRGEPQDPVFTVNSPIGKKPQGRVGLKMNPLSLEEGGLPSETQFERVETRTGTSGTFTLFACFPRTGRQHQIRVHAEIAGHPLVGDKVYGLPEEDVLTRLDGNRDEGRSEASPDPIEEEVLMNLDEPSESYGSHEGEGEDENWPTDQDADEPFEIPGPTASTYAEIEARLLLPRHALHAAGLRFRHPTTRELLTFESDLPSDLKQFFEGLTGAPLEPFRTTTWG
jgi:23S rRNA pseudouridine1911/1915/1917 synthase